MGIYQRNYMKAKTLRIFLAGVVLLSAGACRFHHHRNRIGMNDDNNHVEVQYEGDIEFNDDETVIARISPGGYLEYWHNDEHLLEGTNENGVMKMELYENGKALDTGSVEG